MSKKIVAYGYLAGKTLVELTEKVREEIKKGAEPLGGIIFLGYTREYPNTGGFGVNALTRNLEEIERPFLQTMIQYEEEEENNVDADHRKQRGRSDQL